MIEPKGEPVKERVTAVHYAEVREFFRSVGLIQDLDAGRLTCNLCGVVITSGNFRALTKKEGRILILCDREDCRGSFLFESAGGPK